MVVKGIYNNIESEMLINYIILCLEKEFMNRRKMISIDTKFNDIGF